MVLIYMLDNYILYVKILRINIELVVVYMVNYGDGTCHFLFSLL